MATPPTEPGPDRSTCEVRDWPVFVHGFHKNSLFPDASLDRMERNFAALSSDAAEFRAEDGGPYLTANVKLGHDNGQRAAQSYGLPNVGRVVRVVRGGPRNSARLWLTNVPVKIGGLMNGGHINSGSIEVVDRMADPRDPAKVIDGPVVTAVSLLGEEQPAVKGMGRPVAVFPDGTPVPPDHDVTPLLEAFARSFSDPPPTTIHGRQYATAALCFSDTPPPEAPAVDQLLEQLKALPPDQLQMLLGQIQPGGTQMSAPGTAGGPPPGPATPPADDTGKQFAADGPLTMSAFSSFADECKKMFADLTGRVGAVEKFADEAQKKTDADATATATQMSEQVVDQAIKAGRVMPRDRGLFVEQGVKVLTTKAFADKTGPEAFAAWRADLDGRPTVALFRDAPAAKPTAGPRQLSSLQRVMLRPGGLIARESPEVAKRLLQAGGAA